MGTLNFRGTSVLGGLALAIAIALVPAASASAAAFPNACKNSVTINNSQIDVTITADSPASVDANSSFQLTNIAVEASVPGAIFVSGYNLGLLTVGPNTIPAKVTTEIEATNTVEGAQESNEASTSVSTTISDPDGSPSTGDETATDGTLSFTHNDQTWTAVGTPGTIEFRQDTVPTKASLPPEGALRINTTIGGFLAVRFACSPGTVTGPDPGVVTVDDPAVSFAQSSISGGVVSNDFSFGKPKLNKKKGTAKLPIEVPGPGEVVLVKTSKVKSDQKTAKKAGTVKLKVRAANKAKLKLKKRGKAKVKAKVKYTPDGGESATKSKQVQLKKKKKKR